MVNNFIIKNGTIVDGSGAKPFKGDVAVKGGIITEVSENLPEGDWEVVYDAAGKIVSPGS